jgi:RNA polymerase sigma factor (sigma-70 family)
MTSPQAGCHGDEAELYARYAPKLGRIVARMVRTSNANVEDACAHAWLQMLRYQPARERLLGWLVLTGTREAVRLDHRARREDELIDARASRRAVTLSIEGRLDVLAAREAIAAAGLRQREAEILAAHVAGYSYAEIGLATQITPRTVERQLLRARRKLRDARRCHRPDPDA